MESDDFAICLILVVVPTPQQLKQTLFDVCDHWSMNNDDHQFSQVKNVSPYNNMISTETSGFEIHNFFFFLWANSFIHSNVWLLWFIH